MAKRNEGWRKGNGSFLSLEHLSLSLPLKGEGRGEIWERSVLEEAWNDRFPYETRPQRNNFRKRSGTGCSTLFENRLPSLSLSLSVFLFSLFFSFNGISRMGAIKMLRLLVYRKTPYVPGEKLRLRSEKAKSQPIQRVNSIGISPGRGGRGEEVNVLWRVGKIGEGDSMARLTRKNSFPVCYYFYAREPDENAPIAGFFNFSMGQFLLLLLLSARYPGKRTFFKTCINVFSFLIKVILLVVCIFTLINWDNYPLKLITIFNSKDACFEEKKISNFLLQKKKVT